MYEYVIFRFVCYCNIGAAGYPGTDRNIPPGLYRCWYRRKEAVK